MGFDCRVSGLTQVLVLGFGSDLGSKNVGFLPWVLGFRVPDIITNVTCLKSTDDIIANFFVVRLANSAFTYFIVTKTATNIRTEFRVSVIFRENYWPLLKNF